MVGFPKVIKTKADLVKHLQTCKERQIEERRLVGSS